MKKLNWYRPVLMVFALAFAVRLIYNLVVANGLVARDDSAIYNQIAYALAYHNCFCQYPGVPSISRPPLWPLILSIFYHLAPPITLQQADSSIVVFYGRLFYCFLGSFTCVLVYFLARDLFGKRVGLITGCLAAIYPGLFIYDGWVYAESLYTFLVTAFTYALYRLQRTGKLRWAIWSGVALGLANQDDKLATDAALQWIQTHLGGALLLMSYHVKTMWTPFTAEYNLPFMTFPDHPLSQVVWYMLIYMSPLIFLLAALGLILTWRARWRQLLIVYASLALTIAQNIAFYGNMRFRAPIEPLLVVLVGVLWWFTLKEPGTLHNWRANRKRKELQQTEELTRVV